MDIIRSIDGLPSRIRQTLQQEGYDSVDFRAALRTALKPNATIPILWLVLMNNALLLCSTHRTRGVYHQFGPEGINELRVVKGALQSLSIELIRPDVGEPNLIIPMPVNTASAILQELISLANETLRLS